MVAFPTGPRSRILSSWQVLRDPFSFWEDARVRYGDTFELRAWNGDIVCTGDPAVVAEIFRADTAQVKPFRAEAFAPLLGTNSLLMLWGSAHKEHRRLLSPPFAGSRTKAFGSTFRDVTTTRAATWADGAELRLADEFLTISLEIIVRAVFGILEPGAVASWVRDVRELVAAIDPLFLFFPVLQRLPTRRWRTFLTRRDHLDAAIRSEIADRRASGRRGDDVLSLLLDSTHEDGAPMSEDEIRDELVTLLFAGHETTQIAMSWMVYHLVRSPACLARLRAELDAGDGGPAALMRSPYLDAAWSEALRMTPIVPDMLRTTTTPLTLAGVELPAGTHLAFVAAMVHTRPDLYPEPHVFRPERFLERKFGPSEYLPFGGGVRRCIGAGFATMEGKVVVGTLLRTFDVESLVVEEPARRNATMGVKHGVPVRVRRRVAAAATGA
jgi:cytochrome P450